MSETTALLPTDRQTPADGFGSTAPDRFDDALRQRRAGRGRRALGYGGRLLARPGAVIAALWLLAVAVAAVAPGLIAPGSPYDATPADRLLAPSAQHPFGTDQIGRDLFTRVVHGTGLTLSASAIAVAVGLVVGSALGLVAGFVGGRVDALAMRIADVLLAIPSLLLSLAIVTVLGFGTVNVAVAVGVGSIASVARIMRSEVLRVRQSVYVEAARISGNTWTRVLLRHVLPNSAGPVLVLAVLELGTAILAVSALSFLGFGAPPPAPEWGALVSGGRDNLRNAWWLTVFPGIAIALTVLAANRLSRALDTEGRAVR
ncbi:ABC transporter permease [Microbacterium sp. 18062]|uniref:ABC transporter permease n=1 Tax=Microbacterium sp. 18062 TaxID=2681410 RepID=UPI001357EB6C|nr:ABC transporter permease [Microbacterium sp. 18062]